MTSHEATPELIAQFSAITGEISETSQRYLEMAAGDLEEIQGSSSGGPEDAHGPPFARPDDVPRPTARKSPRKTFATLSDLQSTSTEGAFSGMEDDDESANLFAGGGRSGLAIRKPGDPPYGARSTSDDSQAPGGSPGKSIIKDIFRQAASQTSGNRSSDSGEDSTSATRESSFVGTAYTLGGSQQSSSEPTNPTAPRRPAPRVTRHLTFWQDGFSVEDGPLFRYEDPANMRILADIRSGRAPLSLLNVEMGQEVDVNITKKMEEPYQAKKKDRAGFEGEGRRLGAHVPGDDSNAPSLLASDANAPVEGARSTAVAEPSSDFGNEGDAAVQIRLRSGQVLRARFQSTSLLQQVYDFVDLHTQPRPYILQLTFPNRELSDRSLTIKEAGVVGASLVQKWN